MPLSSCMYWPDDGQTTDRSALSSMCMSHRPPNPPPSHLPPPPPLVSPCSLPTRARNLPRSFRVQAASAVKTSRVVHQERKVGSRATRPTSTTTLSHGKLSSGQPVTSSPRISRRIIAERPVKISAATSSSCDFKLSRSDNAVAEINVASATCRQSATVSVSTEDVETPTGVTKSFAGRSAGATRRTVKRSTYKHVPHREKPPHLVARRNARERKRVQAVNAAFLRLRRHIPYANRNKRLSKVKTLRIAIDYIFHLKQLVDSYDEADENGAESPFERQQQCQSQPPQQSQRQAQQQQHQPQPQRVGDGVSQMQRCISQSGTTMRRQAMGTCYYSPEQNWSRYGE